MALIRKDTRDEIVAQALKEIEFARTYKQGKVKRWQDNERLYYGEKPRAIDSRANVDLGLMASFVHTVLSKIDNPLVFKFTKTKESQLKRAEYLNRLREVDAERDNWDMKDLLGKKQALIYGRAIYSYHVDSSDGYTPHLDNVDVYDFLIDPAAGGFDLENAMYMGRYGVVKEQWQLEKGVKDGLYIKTETKQLIDGHGNADEETQEETNKDSRTHLQGAWNTDKEMSRSDKYKFWEWYTTYKGERYYLLLCETGAKAIRVEKLSDVIESNKYPFWTWAANMDLTEFWTPSYCDYVREVFLAQAVSVNQLLDNAEQINKPQRLVNVTAIEDLSDLKYRRSGLIKVKNVDNIDKAYQTVKTPAITTPIKVYEMLDSIQEKASGVTAGTKGVAEEDKVGIYEGNQANAADRFGLLNKTYAFGYKRFARLWEDGVREHLTKKISVDYMGPEGLEIVKISRRDLFRKNENYGIIVEASNAEILLSQTEKRTKIAFLNSQATNPVQNNEKAYEMQARIAGFSPEETRQLMDTSQFGDAELMSEAERDIEALLDGDDIALNQGATTAYKQRFVDYMTDHHDSIDNEQFARLTLYIARLDEVIMRNMVRKANNLAMQQKLAIATGELQDQPGSQRAVKEPESVVSPELQDNNIG